MINSSTTPQQVPNLDPYLDAPEDSPSPWPDDAEFVEEVVGNEIRTYVFADGWLIDAWSVTVF